MVNMGHLESLHVGLYIIGVMLGQLRVRVGRLLEAKGLMNQVALHLCACVSPKPDTVRPFYGCI